MTLTYLAKTYIVRFFYILTAPIALISLAGYLFRSSESAYVTFAKLLSLIPGKIGNYIRTSYYMLTLTECHYDLSVDFCTFFAHPNARVGRSVVIGSFTIIGSADLHDNVLISSRVSILSGKFQHKVGSDISPGIYYEGFDNIIIGNGTWIGEGAIVMANIGNSCIVSAGSTVTKSMKSNTTAIGNPARFINLEV